MNEGTSTPQPEPTPEIHISRGDALVLRESMSITEPAYSYLAGHALRVTDILGDSINVESALRRTRVSNSCFEKAEYFQKIHGSHFGIQKGDVFKRTAIRSGDPLLDQNTGVEMTIVELHPDYIEMEILPVEVTISRDDIRRGLFDVFKAEESK